MKRELLNVFSNRPALIGYIILIVFLCVAFIEMQSTQARLEEEAILRQEAVCSSYQQMEDILATIITNITDQNQSEIQQTPEDLPPSVQELIEQSQEANRQFKTDILLMLEEAQCPTNIEEIEG